MSSAGAKRAVVAFMALSAGAAIFRAARRGQTPRMRIALGALVAAVVLSAIADAAPTIAVGMAATTFVVALMGLGPDAIETIGSSVRKASK